MSGIRVENPATGEVLETFDHVTEQEALAAVDTAHEAFLSWRETPIEERAKVVTRVAELFEERKDELAEIIATEMGKPISEGLEEAEFSSAIFGYYADNGPKFAADEEIPVEMDGKGYIQRLPIGVLLGIMPWNLSLIHI